jgi:hypothetical protein
VSTAPAAAALLAADEGPTGGRQTASLHRRLLLYFLLRVVSLRAFPVKKAMHDSDLATSRTTRRFGNAPRYLRSRAEYSEVVAQAGATLAEAPPAGTRRAFWAHGVIASRMRYGEGVELIGSCARQPRCSRALILTGQLSTRRSTPERGEAGAELACSTSQSDVDENSDATRRLAAEK